MTFTDPFEMIFRVINPVVFKGNREKHRCENMCKHIAYMYTNRTMDDTLLHDGQI